jgi:hypothetical protein
VAGHIAARDSASARLRRSGQRFFHRGDGGASTRAAPGEANDVGSFAPEQCQWIVEPMVEAGLDLDRIRGLVFRMAFTGIVAEYRGTPASLADVVEDEPAEVRRAWSATVARLLALQESAT